MFLEEKLDLAFQQEMENYKNFGVSNYNNIINVVIRHVKEAAQDSIDNNRKWDNQSSLNFLKQTDTIWRQWCKKMKLTDSVEAVRLLCIIPQFGKYGSVRDYFKITPEEIEKYGKE